MKGQLIVLFSILLLIQFNNSLSVRKTELLDSWTV